MLVHAVTLGLALSSPPPDWIAAYLGAHRALEAGRLEDARRGFLAVLDAVPRHGGAAWQLAGVAARSGDPGEALEWLERAVEQGETDVAMLEWDPDLEGIRESPRFAELRAALSVESGPPLAEVGLFVPDGGPVPSPPRFSVEPISRARSGPATQANRPSTSTPPSPAASRLEMRTTVAVHPTGGEVWIGGADGSVRRVDARTGDLLGTRRLGAAVTAIVFDDDGTRTLTADRAGRIEVVATRDDRLLASASPSGALEDDWFVPDRGWRAPIAEFSPDGRSIVYCDAEKDLYVLQASSLETRFTMTCPEDYRSKAAFWAWSPTQVALAVARSGGRVELRDAVTGAVTGRIEVAGRVAALEYEPDGQRLWVLADYEDRHGFEVGFVHVFDVTDGSSAREVATVDLRPYGYFSIELGSLSFGAADLAVVGTRSWASVIAIRLSEEPTVSWSFSPGGGNPAVVRAAVGTDGRYVYAWGQIMGARVFDADSGDVVLDLSEQASWSMKPIASEHAVVVHGNGVEVREVPDGVVRWRRFDLLGDEWLVQTAGGACNGTRAALGEVLALVDGALVEFQELAPLLLDPKRVRAAKLGVPLRPVASLR